MIYISLYVSFIRCIYDYTEVWKIREDVNLFQFCCQAQCSGQRKIYNVFLDGRVCRSQWAIPLNLLTAQICAIRFCFLIIDEDKDTVNYNNIIPAYMCPIGVQINYWMF